MMGPQMVDDMVKGVVIFVVVVAVIAVGAGFVFGWLAGG